MPLRTRALLWARPVASGFGDQTGTAETSPASKAAASARPVVLDTRGVKAALGVVSASAESDGHVTTRWWVVRTYSLLGSGAIVDARRSASSSRTTSLKRSGTIGRSATRHILKRMSYSSGWASCGGPAICKTPLEPGMHRLWGTSPGVRSRGVSGPGVGHADGTDITVRPSPRHPRIGDKDETTSAASPLAVGRGGRDRARRRSRRRRLRRRQQREQHGPRLRCQEYPRAVLGPLPQGG